MQNIQFGAARASRLGDQVAAHSGGYLRAGADQCLLRSVIEIQVGVALPTRCHRPCAGREVG